MKTPRQRGRGRGKGGVRWIDRSRSKAGGREMAEVSHQSLLCGWSPRWRGWIGMGSTGYP